MGPSLAGSYGACCFGSFEKGFPVGYEGVEVQELLRSDHRATVTQAAVGFSEEIFKYACEKLHKDDVELLRKSLVILHNCKKGGSLPWHHVGYRRGERKFHSGWCGQNLRLQWHRKGDSTRHHVANVMLQAAHYATKYNKIAILCYCGNGFHAGPVVAESVSVVCTELGADCRCEHLMADNWVCDHCLPPNWQVPSSLPSLASTVLNELRMLAQEFARAAPEPELAQQLSGHFPFEVPSVWDYVLLRAQLPERCKVLRDRLEASYQRLPEVRPQNPLIPGGSAGAASALNAALRPPAPEPRFAFLLLGGDNAAHPSQPMTDVGSQRGYGEGWHRPYYLRGSFCELNHMDELQGKQVQELSLLQCAYAVQSWCTVHKADLHEKLPQINEWYLSNEMAKALARWTTEISPEFPWYCQQDFGNFASS